jgi:hypothetical protein
MAARIVFTAKETKEAIDALGGASVVANLLGVGPNAVRNWYRRGFPPETYAMLAPRLRKAGCDFSTDLFRQYAVGTKPPPPPRWRKNGGRR